MAEFDDLPLQSSAPHTPPPGRSWAWLGIPLILAVGGVLWYFAFRPPPADERPAASTPRGSTAVPPAPRVNPEPGEDIALPPLDGSDPLVRDLVARLSAHPRVAAWLTTDGLIRNFAVSVVNVADGRTPARHLGKVGLAGPFQVRDGGQHVYVDPRSYARYDSHAEAVGALDARGTARLYATLKPRIEDAYRELGYPQGHFDSVLERAIAELLATPVIEGSVGLASKSVNYEFADPRLESLSSAQRQFLRMGPRNVKLIQAKLREIASLAGLQAGAQP